MVIALKDFKDICKGWNSRRNRQTRSHDLDFFECEFNFDQKKIKKFIFEVHDCFDENVTMLTEIFQQLSSFYKTNVSLIKNQRIVEVEDQFAY